MIYSFDVEFIQNRTIFIIYMIYIVILYMFIWRKFMSIMSNELWRTKTMLRYISILFIQFPIVFSQLKFVSK